MSERPDVVEVTPRVCRYCGVIYVAPKGSRPHACRACAPTIEMDIADRARERDAREQPSAATAVVAGPSASAPARELVRLPAPPDRFAGECERKSCSNIAEVLIEGSYLCVDCADDLLDRMVAADVSPELAAMLPAFWEA